MVDPREYVERPTGYVVELAIEAGVFPDSPEDLQDKMTALAYRNPGVMRTLVKCALEGVQWGLAYDALVPLSTAEEEEG